MGIKASVKLNTQILRHHQDINKQIHIWVFNIVLKCVSFVLVLKITKMWFLIDILGGLAKWLFWGPTAYPHTGQSNYYILQEI